MPFTPEVPPSSIIAACASNVVGTLTSAPREYEADFEEAGYSLSGTSTTRRPDAISLDYLTAYTFGPYAIGDVNTEGAYSRPWKCRVSGNSVYVAKANDSNTAWMAETLLFTNTGAAIREIDVSFEQLGRPVVCAEKADGHIWIYFFDPVTPAGFKFLDFGLGRTPRCVLDNPPDVTDSDVIVFFIDDVQNRIVYLTQRDRYLVKVAVALPVTSSLNFLEDAVITRGNRVAVYYSTRNVGTGRYDIARIATTLYPVILELESVSHVAAFTPGASTLVVILQDATLTVESVSHAASVQSGILVVVVTDYTMVVESVSLAASVQSGELRDLLIATLTEESVSLAAAMQSGELRDQLQYTMEQESVSLAASIISGTLAP